LREREFATLRPAGVRGGKFGGRGIRAAVVDDNDLEGDESAVRTATADSSSGSRLPPSL
jgi:hypothetical protein